MQTRNRQQRMFLLLFGRLLLLTTEYIHFSASYVINSSGDVVTKPAVFNLCQSPCSAACSPECLADCCVTKSELPCAPSAAVARAATAYSNQGSAKADMMISSVEEGETEECEERGFGSPTDNSADPPGTITIPLPPTMYTPPRPGEEGKEMPLPDFHLPASVLQGKMPDNSITLNPIGTSATLPKAPLQQGPEAGKTTLPCITPPASQISTLPTLPTLPSQPIIPPQQPVLSAPVGMPKLPPVHIASPPPPPSLPPPCGVTQVMPSGGTLVYPKLPPVTVSEIPKKKIPLALLNKAALLHSASAVQAASTSLPQVGPLNCPASCSYHCLPDCRDECCKAAKGNTPPVLSSAPPPALLSTSLFSPPAAHIVASSPPSSPPAAHLVTSLPSSPPSTAAFLPAAPVSPCPHNPDSCTINFGPAVSLNSYPPSDLPTEVLEFNPSVVSLTSPPMSALDKGKLDEKFMKEMEEKLNITCGKSSFRQA